MANHPTQDDFPQNSDDTKPEDALASMELPVVILGETTSPEGQAPQQRVLPGRVRQSTIFYPVYLLLVISGGISANFALDTEEWAFGPVVVAWLIMFFWNWIYVIAWEYQRKWLKMFCVFWLVTMEGSMAFICYDRGLPQHVFRNKLVYREAILSLTWASAMLWICLALFIAHLVFFGRGYRKKQSRTKTEEPQQEGIVL